MRTLTTWVAVLLTVGLYSVQAQDQCVTCHNDLRDKASKAFKTDVHFRWGLSCADCHGGDRTNDDMDDAMDAKAGFIGIPSGDLISETCARCHSDSTRMRRFGSKVAIGQFEALAASEHGHTSTTGGSKLLQCTTCHGAHGVVSVKSPASPVHPLRVVQTCAQCHANASYMKRYNPSLPVDQVDKYRTSVHGQKNSKGDWKTAVCSSCHGGHDILAATSFKSKVNAVNVPRTCGHCHSDSLYMKEYGIPTDQETKFIASVHGEALLKKNDHSAPVCNDCHGNHGAAPPGVESISKVCGQCHALNAELFSASPHKKAFDDNNIPECETCHGKHDITHADVKMLGVAPTSVCYPCHGKETESKGYQISKRMREMIDSLSLEEKHAAVLIDEAEQKGMEISESKFKLRDVNQARLESRTMIHSFDEKRFREVVQKGLDVTNFVQSEALRAVDEYAFRRWGLGFSTLVITILALSIFLLIRRIER